MLLRGNRLVKTPVIMILTGWVEEGKSVKLLKLCVFHKNAKKDAKR
jgi:hypothetical protein